MSLVSAVLPALVAAAMPTPPAAMAADAPERERPLWSSLAIAATYGGGVRGGASWQGLGALLAVDEPRWRRDPELWIEIRDVLPSGREAPTSVIQTISARAGLSAGAWSHLRLGLGAGVDRETTTRTIVTLDPRGGGMSSITLMPDWQPAARVFARVVSGSYRGFSVSTTLFVDAVHSPDPTNTFRAGLTLEAWWRSSSGD